MPSARKKRLRSSTWPSVSSPAMPARARGRRARRGFRAGPGHLSAREPRISIGFRRQDSVVSRRPAPFTSIDPPSSTIGFATAAGRAPAPSGPESGCPGPGRIFAAPGVVVPVGDRDLAGPPVLRQKSARGRGTGHRRSDGRKSRPGSAFAPSRSDRARFCTSGARLMRTFSNRLMIATISANRPGIGRKRPGQVSRLCGHDSQTAAWGSHSAGMRKPSAAGVGSRAADCNAPLLETMAKLVWLSRVSGEVGGSARRRSAPHQMSTLSAAGRRIGAPHSFYHIAVLI